MAEPAGLMFCTPYAASSLSKFLSSCLTKAIR
jgi:hypothetical protein